MAVAQISRRERIKRSIRQKLSGTTERPRLSVFRSNTNIYAQIINDATGQTLVSANVKEVGLKGNNLAASAAVGKKIAEKALAAGISTVVFDRNGYLYHGKIKSLADGAREGGLQF
jgi:large subunit ribosomal protein L18